MKNTYVHKCNCTHEYQDAKHGKGYRAMNVTAKGKTKEHAVVRCTVCLKEYTIAT